MIQRWLLATFVLLIVGVPGSRAQEVPPAPPKTPAAYEKAEQRFRQDHEAAKQKLVDVLTTRRDGEKDAARKARLELELAAFRDEQTLPASSPKEAVDYLRSRRLFLKTLCNELNAQFEKCTKGADAEVVESMRERLAVQQEKLDVALWDDLRCDADFERTVKANGLLWEGSNVLTPVDRDMVCRVRSPQCNQFNSYRLRVSVERVSGGGPLRICFPMKVYAQVGVLVLDGGQGATSGLDAINQESFDRNRTKTTGVRLAKDDVVDVIVTYQSHRIQVHVDGQRIIDCDEVKNLSMPTDLEKGVLSKDAVWLMSKQDTQFRILGMGIREFDEAVPIARESGPQRKGPQEDLLPVGAVFQGRDERNSPCTMKVVARNQSGDTATLEFKSGDWRIRMLVNDVAQNGVGFAVGDIKRIGTPVRIWDEKGRGSVSAQRVHIIASWRNAYRGQREFREFTFTGRR